MAKLTRKEKEKITLQMKSENERGPIWTVRPTFYQNKAGKYNTKISRREGKKICREG